MQPNLTIGEHTYGTPTIKYCNGRDCPKVIIGKYCSIAEGVEIWINEGHPINWVSTFPFRIRFNLDGKYIDGMPKHNGDIIIGNDVWIGAHVLIMSGVTIGDGAIIGAGSVVRHHIAPYTMVMGNPTKYCGLRFTEAQVEELLQIKWWDWPDYRVKSMVPLLSSGDIDEFIRVSKTLNFHRENCNGN